MALTDVCLAVDQLPAPSVNPDSLSELHHPPLRVQLAPPLPPLALLPA
jgi:hypothetical protein